MKWIVLALVVVSASQVLAKRCKSNDDCEEDECCVNFILVSWFGGHCQKYKQEGEICPIIDADEDEKPDMYHFMCPCKEGLECQPDKEFKIGEHIIVKQPGCVAPGEVTTEVTTDVPQEE
ncbi:Toxin CSTX-20 like protein [Argiope bruennichi]|uniref:Toxin CSTX-20 like protein n=1 Tax=Argiope bruennichi TaxID=94029 RepID=A0A8T0G014_ARGBR|nr:Toxin CSTX-20 like protein [Argiope bruennichi]